MLEINSILQQPTFNLFVYLFLFIYLFFYFFIFFCGGGGGGGMASGILCNSVPLIAMMFIFKHGHGILLDYLHT